MHIILTGPSGSGKSSFISKIKFTLNLPLSISFTTRQKRKHETNGIDYNFITVDEFKNKILNNELEEYTNFNNNFYGTPKLTNQTSLFDLEYEGVLHFYNHSESGLFIYINVDKSILKDRLIKRESDEEDVIKRMLKYDKFEKLLDEVKFDLVVDNNGEFENTVATIEDFLRKKLN